MTVISKDGDRAAVGPLVQGEHADGVAGFHYLADPGLWQWSGAPADGHGAAPDAADGHGAAPDSTVEVFGQHVHAEDRGVLAAAIERIVGGHPVRSHYRLITHAGQTRWVVMVAHPVTDAVGTVTGSSGFVVDVSDAVQAALTSALPDVVRARGPVEQAKGVLMAARGLSADDAFGVLVRRSQDTNVKVGVIASRFLAILSGRVSGAARAQVDGALVAAGVEVAPQLGSASGVAATR